jgi:Kef-type K+ transport system membrane component KefB
MHHDTFSLLLVQLVLLIGLGMIGRLAARSLAQPEVLGELLAGVLFVNLVHLGGGSLVDVIGNFKTFANLGAVILLFVVGLQTNIHDLLNVGRRSMIIAIVGVLSPFLLGLLSLIWLTPDYGMSIRLFIAATLCATSIGITARLFKDLKMLNSREAKVVLGAAVIDDVLGLVLLTIMSGIAVQGHFEFWPALKISAIAVVFLGGVLWLGETLVGNISKSLAFLEPGGRRLLLPLMICFLFSWLASEAGLASIVGAFAAGAVLRDEHLTSRDGLRISEEIAPLESLFAPLFFVLMGLQVELATLFQGQVLLLAIGLCIVAVLGKMACAMVSGPGIDGLKVGIGMIPRGEVGLIFAGVGRTLDVLDKDIFAALVIMIIFTTVITPPAMRWAVERNANSD